MVYLRMRSALNEPIWYGSGGQVHPGDGREHGSSGAGVQPWSAGHLSSAAASGQAFLGGPPAFVGAGTSFISNGVRTARTAVGLGTARSGSSEECLQPCPCLLRPAPRSPAGLPSPLLAICH